MKKLLVILILFSGFSAVLGSSLSPREAEKRAAEASCKEAKTICDEIETELSEYYDGKKNSYSTKFVVRHPFTAHFVGEHFSDNWTVRWNQWYKVDDHFSSPLANGYPFERKVFDGKDEDDKPKYIWLPVWKITLTPKIAE